MKQTQRITIPLFHVVFDDSVAGRVELDKDVVLAKLNEQESKRVQEYHARAAGYSDETNIAIRLRPPSHRVEIFSVANQELSETRIAVHDKIADVLSLLAVASRGAPVWYSEPIDKWNHDVKRWERLSVFNNRGGAKPDFVNDEDIESYLPTTVGPAWRVSGGAVQAWGRLLALWRPLPGNSPLRIAARYFYDAILRLLDDPWRAFISASICLECILGDGIVELSYRISQRAANLGRVVDLDSSETFQNVRRAYNARSKLVHEGRRPDTPSVVGFVELLRKLLPIMAVLDNELGSHKQALGEIDVVGIGEDQIIANLKGKADTWSLPDIEGGGVPSPKEHRKLVKDLFPELDLPEI